MLPYQMDASNLQVVPLQQAEPVQMQAQEIQPIPVVQKPVPIQAQAPVQPQVRVEVPAPESSPAAVQPVPVEEKKLTFLPRVASNQIVPQQDENVAKSTVAPLSAGSFCLQIIS